MLQGGDGSKAAALTQAVERLGERLEEKEKEKEDVTEKLQEKVRACVGVCGGEGSRLAVAAPAASPLAATWRLARTMGLCSLRGWPGRAQVEALKEEKKAVMQAAR